MNLFEQQLLHYIMTTQIISENAMLLEAEKIKNFVMSTVSHNSREFLEISLSNINRNIKQYDFEILKGKSELTGENFYVFAATSEHPIIDKIKGIAKNKISFLKTIIEQCVLAPNKAISETQCINLNNHADMSKTESENTLEELIKMKWLETKDGYVYVGIRSVIELIPEINKNFEGYVKNCPLCQAKIIFGKQCSKCDSFIHVHCMDKYLERANQCPNCKSLWTTQLPEMMDIVTE